MLNAASTLKVTFFIVIIFLIGSCKPQVRSKFDAEIVEAYQSTSDSITGKQIDSLYEVWKCQCDSIKQKRLPGLIDSILQKTR